MLAWAGMRGVVTLAAALSISADVPQRTLLVCVAFTVAVVSLLLYGGTLPMVIERLKVRSTDPRAVRTEFEALMTELGEAAIASVGDADPLVIDGHLIEENVVAEVTSQYEKLRGARADDQVTDGNLTQRQQRALMRRTYLDAMREALHDERAIGAYSTAALSKAEQLLDAEELRLDR